MTSIKLLSVLAFLFIFQTVKSASDEALVIIEQDYNRALKIASEEDKLIFIDFYTTWCVPCKQLDKQVFQNDSIQQLLSKNFILLKYNAEQDTVFHLAKKHHVSSYPTGLVLNKNGYVVNRKYGFPGNDPQSLRESVLKFTDASIHLNDENRFIKGYSNAIAASKYPDFYVAFVNRTNTKVDPVEVSDYLDKEQDVFSEEYFSTLIYFGSFASDELSRRILKEREEYKRLYGETDVNLLLYFLTSGQFGKAISAKSSTKFDEAVDFAKSALGEEGLNDALPYFQESFLKAQGQWEEVFELKEDLKQSGDFSNGAINHFCWDVYKNCDDQQVIAKCLTWMKEVTDQEPEYLYLDTYAFLMYKSGDKDKTKKITLRAIEAANKEGESTKALEKLLSKL